MLDSVLTKKNVLILLTILLVSCQKPSENIPVVTKQKSENLDKDFENLVQEHQLISVGAAIIKNGKVAWTGYYGEEKPGKPTSKETLFDVASITKTVSTETILRLAYAGKLSLDESMSNHWIDPDIKDDPRHNQLTPAMALNHTTGFRNWRFFSDDNTLQFVNDPGTNYGYSGEGFEYVSKFAENKLGKPFNELVQEEVFDPIGISNVSFSVDSSLFEKMARPEDDEGNFYGYYCRPGGWCRDEGGFSAADDMVITVEGYAKFLIAVMDGGGYNDNMATNRNKIHTQTQFVDCDLLQSEECPQNQGYGLGWRILDYGHHKMITHGGSDWSEVALAYFYTNSKDGLIIFFNAPNKQGIQAMPEAIELIDPDSPMAEHYRMRIR